MSGIDVLLPAGLVQARRTPLFDHETLPGPLARSHRGEVSRGERRFLVQPLVVLDRWLQIFHDTIDGGWSGPNAEIAKKRGTGMVWAMANRLLGRGAWKPAEHR